MRKVGTLIAPTQKTFDVLREYGMHQEIHIIPTGISLERYEEIVLDEEKRQLRLQYDISEQAFVMISLGRLGTEKHIEELLELFYEVTKNTTDSVFVIVGDGPARQELETYAKQLGVFEKVIFTGAVAQETVGTYYQMADVFVSASTSETQGLVYIEAAANGLPLICRKDPCLDGIITEGVNGFCYETPDEFKIAFLKCKNDADFRKKAGATSRNNVRKYDKHSFAEAVEEVYRSATAF